jgi:PAS domain S-box-containing protein
MAGDISADLRQILDHLPDGVLFLDRQWRITYANVRARAISRIRPEDLNGRTHWELYPSTVDTEQERKYRRSMDERVEEEGEVFYAPFEAWIRWRTLPIETGIAIYYQDVTELHVVGEEAASVNRQLQQVFDVTTDAVTSLSREWRFTFVNRRAKELLGAGEDLVGGVIWNRFPDAVYPGSPYVENYYKTMNDRVPTTFEAYYPEPLNKWLRLECRPSADGIVVFFRDISRQKSNEQRLRDQQAEAEKQRAELEAVYRTAPVGLALFEPKEFRYLRVNDRQSEVLGISPAELIGRKIEDVVISKEVTRLFREKVLKGETVRDYLYETDLWSRPGEVRSFNVNYSPVFGEDGEVRAISAAVLEVTQLRKVEQALRQSEKLAAVGRLASSISHEINNPLEAVTNLLYLVEHEERLPAAAQEYVQQAQAELSRVSQIVTHTLRFHRQANKPTLVTASQLVDAVLNLYQGRLMNSRIEVEAMYRTETRIECFENDIRQVLNNLIANAIDAMRTGGRLVVRAHDARHPVLGTQGVRIAVADSGSGMTPETRQRLFEPFYTTKGLNGTGLGLWISQEIVARHRGELRVRSSQDELGHGTVFTLFLPVSAAR